ncbi:MAG: gliding motility-associated C-terminal domain-containing protein [Saprospiraceae bacterium]|nr:gliding motility-associated C-terminal domain-containing protein [Saprospiraceae bacterium]
MKISGLFIFFLTLVQLSAQPMICQKPETMTPTCLQACLICDINGFTGKTGDGGVGQLPIDFCTTVKHNAQWIAFMAGSTNLTLKFSVFKCRTGAGLEIGIFESSDCKNFTKISNCDGDVAENTSTILKMTKPLVIGQYYYVVMDGNMDDVCSYKIDVLDGTTAVWPLDQSGPILGPDTICNSDVVKYTTTPVIGGIFYKWTLDGKPLANALSVNVQPKADFTLCVQASNVCDTAAVTCKNVILLQGDSIHLDRQICTGDCMQVGDSIFCTSGKYKVNLKNNVGCDSIIDLNLRLIPESKSTLQFDVCEGDSLLVGNQFYSAAGIYTQKYLSSQLCDSTVYIEISAISKSFGSNELTLCEGDTNWVNGITYNSVGTFSQKLKSYKNCDSILTVNVKMIPDSRAEANYTLCEGDTLWVNQSAYFKAGDYVDNLISYQNCDSIVIVHIKTILCNIPAVVDVNHIKCFNDQNGSVIIKIDLGNAPFVYMLSTFPGNLLIQQGIIQNLNDSVVINKLPAGMYQINIKDSYGNEKVIYTEVKQPLPLQVQSKISGDSVYQIRCNGDANAFIEVNANGGTPNYKYVWNNGWNSNRISNLDIGSYTVKVQDQNQCELILDFSIKQPEPIQFQTALNNPDCYNESSGTISLSSISGGIPQYQFSIDGRTYSDKVKFDSLSDGKYTVYVRDSIGCLSTKRIDLIAPEKNNLSGKEYYEIGLGDSVLLDLYYSGQLKNLNWTPPDWLSCADCPYPIAKPLKDSKYTLNTTSKDGCPDSLIVFIKVITNRGVWAPNVFSPNGDLVNDYFTLVGSNEVKSIKKLEVYSRWGELIYSGKELIPNVYGQGWDGTFRGEKLNPAVFVWRAEVVFLDDVSLEFSGEVTLLK